ncbi:hypothetical protein HFQ13_09360 [Acidithiobacillus sp. VAN18-1]|uniref:Uncharacterized protein n=1 Tax=Igneacidithiobacillus copahuensis TaxID=2724909 RepID=A0AAE3CK50_9PROT|nr:hypothetical protein [Igneacidithiobacillus copahuensis]
MNIVQNYCEQDLPGLADHYTWNISNNVLNFARDNGLVITVGNSLERNLRLRAFYHQLYLKGSEKMRIAVIRSYVKDWGGIHALADDNIERYARGIGRDGIDINSIKNVASYSKALAVIDPQQYTIFDARVGASLNSLFLLNNKTEIFFPSTPSRNEIIRKFQRMLRPRIPYRTPSYGYREYLDLLHQVKKRLQNNGVEIQSIEAIEMLLFAKAESLCGKAMEAINQG